MVDENGYFTIPVSLSVPGHYVLTLNCVSPSGQLSEREIYVQRAPEMSYYTATAYTMNYAAFTYPGMQAYCIEGTVTDIIKDDDYILAELEIESGDKLILEYHNHYGSAATIEIGKTYHQIYGRPLGRGEDGLPHVYVWFIND